MKQYIRIPLFPTGGINSGIEPIDRRHGGFRPGQMVAVVGPNQSMNYAFLFSLGKNAALIHQKKVDMILTENSPSSPLLNQYFESQYTSLTISNESGVRKPSDHNLRIIDLDYGNPDFNGWERYCQIIKEKPPDVLILDGTYSLKEFLDVKSLGKHLLSIVNDLNIIIAVNTSWPSLGMCIDPEFERFANVFIRFSPHYFVNRKNDDGSMVKVYYVETTLNAAQPELDFMYGAAFEMTFVEENLGYFEKET